ncbi:hypothetical protein Q3G72_029651 [Acer saccharum]|nr:hypothetical protein Q3G72_029651 [Acer saccharum]
MAMVVVVEALPPLIQTPNHIYFKPNTSNSSSKRIKSGGPVICDHPDSKHAIGVGLVGPLWSANDERVSDQDVDLVDQELTKLRITDIQGFEKPEKVATTNPENVAVAA